MGSSENQFEIERRVILFKSTTSLPDGSTLGWNADPNTVNPAGTDGEQLLYNSPMGTRYIQNNGDEWRKLSVPNNWVPFGSSGLLAGSGLISANTAYHIQIGSGLYLQDNLVGFDRSWADSHYAISGDIAPNPNAGSGLIQVGANYHVQVGDGISLSDNDISVDTTWADARFIYSAGTGLTIDGTTYNVIGYSGITADADGLQLDISYTNALYDTSGNLSGHLAASDPHPQYLTQSEGDVRYSLSGTGGGGTAAGSGLNLAAGAYNVQTGSGLYLTDDVVGFNTSFGDTRYQLSGSIADHNHDNQYEESGVLETHENAADPHPQYFTLTEGNAQWEVSGTVIGHEAESDPHPQYLTTSEGITGGGTANYIPKYTDTAVVGDSVIYDTGSIAIIGATSFGQTVKLGLTGQDYLFGLYNTTASSYTLFGMRSNGNFDLKLTDNGNAVVNFVDRLDATQFSFDLDDGSIKAPNLNNISQSQNMVQYNTSTGELTWASIQGTYDVSGSAAAEVSAHVSDSDPHSQYLTQAEGDALYATSGSGPTSFSGLSDTQDTGWNTTGFIPYYDVGAGGIFTPVLLIQGIPTSDDDATRYLSDTTSNKVSAFEIYKYSQNLHSTRAFTSRIIASFTNNDNRTVYGGYIGSYAGPSGNFTNNSLVGLHTFSGPNENYTYVSGNYKNSIGHDTLGTIYNGPIYDQVIASRARLTLALSGKASEAMYYYCGSSDDYIDDNTPIISGAGLKIGDITRSSWTNVDALSIKPQIRSSGASRGNIHLYGSGYNTGHLQLDDMHLWPYNGKLYWKQGDPTSDTDGTELGAGGAGSTSFSGLSDVQSTSWTSGRLARYNGSEWVPYEDQTGGAGSSEDLVTVSGNYSVATGVTTVLASGSASITITLPSVAGDSRFVRVKNFGTNIVIVSGTSADGALLDGETRNRITSQYVSRTFQEDGTNWWII